MRLNRAELRKILTDFNGLSNRVLKADWKDYISTLNSYLNFVRNTPVIYEYIVDCGSCQLNIDEQFKEVLGSDGNKFFYLGTTPEEEVCNIFALLENLSKREVDVLYFAAKFYINTGRAQEHLDAFNKHVTWIFIDDIGRYLSKLGIDMGVDDKVVNSINLKQGQVNIANDNATITATNNIGADLTQLSDLINKVKESAKGLTGADAETLSESLDVLEKELNAEKPNKAVLKLSTKMLRIIKGSTEFMAATATLIQFVQPFLQ